MIKKRGSLFCLSLLILFFSFNFVSSLDSNLKSIYDSKETVIIDIKGNLLSNINKEDVFIKRANVIVPVEYGVRKITGRQFIWFIAPENSSNYTLLIKDITTTINGKVQVVDYSKDFFLSENLTAYNVNPGILYSDEDFEVKVFSFLDEDFEVKVIGEVERTILLKPGENKIKFEIEEFSATGFKEIVIGDYVIPSYIIAKDNEIIKPRSDIFFRPSIIESVIYIEEGFSDYPFAIINNEKRKIDLQLIYNKDIFVIEKSENLTIDPEQILFLKLNLAPLVKYNKNLEEKIIVKLGEEEYLLPVYINFTEKKDEAKTPYLEEGFNESSLRYCDNLGGEICIAGEVCNSEVLDSREGECCLGQCISPQSQSSYSWIGYLIAGIVLLILIFVYLKYKKSNSSISTLRSKA